MKYTIYPGNRILAWGATHSLILPPLIKGEDVGLSILYSKRTKRQSCLWTVFPQSVLPFGSRQTPNISALCDTSETQWCGIRLQTAASKPHGPIPFGFPMPLQPSIPKSSPEGGKSSISHTDSLSTRNKPSISWRWLVGICISYILRTNGLPKPLGHCGIQN